MVNEIDILLQAVQEAGSAVLALQKKGFYVTKKANNDLLAEADLLANDILAKTLLHHFPDDGWLSEESSDSVDRLQKKRVWVVDPIDGTKEFVAGIPEYAISVALVEAGTPCLAAVFNPATDELFYAVKNTGAWLGKDKIQCRPTAHQLVLLASRSEYERGEWVAYAAKHEVKVVGSIAYKMALVAAGQAHATFSLGFKNEWDIAAGTLLITEAGGVVTNKQKEKLLFNQSDAKIAGVVATNAANNALVFSLIGSS